MLGVEDWAEIRRLHRAERMPIRVIARVKGLSHQLPVAPRPPPTGTAADGATGHETCPTANATAFAKTRCVAHAGLAFGAFHRYLYKTYRAGSITSGHNGRVVALVQAGASALFTKRELRLAIGDVEASPALCNAIAGPMANLGNSISGAVSKLKNGGASRLTTADTAVSDIKSRAAGVRKTPSSRTPTRRATERRWCGSPMEHAAQPPLRR